ncbi:MAG TPA: ATP-binding cassette domain-containing protein [Solirubrobacteraceae bacterium]|jgi:ABC-2 type transport system ATP-binding protein|nr:ATP-binding cassette domain-containing protein [Solirubrobacteraceae bacterium]
MTDKLAIEAHGLRKSYGDVDVLRGIDITAEGGSVLALLGPNGAGKTTTVKILTTLIRADAGTACVAGFDVVGQRRAVRRSISLAGQSAALDGPQTGEENLRMIARLAGLDRREARTRATELLDRFDLTEAGGRRVATYSGGMRRRLDLAASLVGRPGVIFLDEPTTGLDPRSRQGLWDVVEDLARSGVTVLLTTQYLEEADRLADRIAVIDGGRIVAEGTAAMLKRRVADQRLELVFADPASFAAASDLLGRRVLRSEPARHLIAVATDGRACSVRAVLDEVDPEATRIDRFEVHGATLDDVFLTLTGAGPAGPGSSSIEPKEVLHA